MSTVATHPSRLAALKGREFEDRTEFAKELVKTLSVAERTQYQDARRTAAELVEREGRAGL